MKFIKTHRLLILSIFLLIASTIYIILVGDTYLLTIETNEYSRLSDTGEITAIASEEAPGYVSVLDIYREGKDICVKVQSEKPGKVYLELFQDGEIKDLEILYVHPTGVVTRDDYFGHCTGSFEVRVMWVLFLLLLITSIVRKYAASLKDNMYQYTNIIRLGIIFFLCLIFAFQVLSLPNQGGAVDSLYMIMNTLTGVEMFTIPITVVVFIMVTISNIKLIKNEGKSFRNLLAVIQGFCLLIASILPFMIGTFFQTTTIIDVHNWRGFGRFIEMFVENTCGIIIIYLECILVATIVFGIKAAKHIPKFNKDYIIIHGSMIRKDGTLPKLLQSRADRAIEFAKMQKEAKGKDIKFIPSGGQGSDEVISEAEAIKNYLIEQGISEDQMLI